MVANVSVRDGLDFSDVLIAPAESQVKPEDVVTKTRLTREIDLGLPLISAARNNVTESMMAIAMAQLGGLGIIHDDMPVGRQVEEVRRVKRAGGEIVSNPITVSPETSVAEALDLMRNYRISGLPVIDAAQKVVGIVTNRDVRFFEDVGKPVSELMTKKVITVKHGTTQDEARRLMHEHRIEKLIVLDEQGRCAGLMTVKDVEKLIRYPHATRDVKGFLRVGAAVGTGKEAFDRVSAMVDTGLDVVFVDVAHGHTKDALSIVSRIRQQRSSAVQIVAGNVATLSAARSLIDAGADAIKVGVGATGYATVRKIGVGVPQLSAIMDVVEQCDMQNTPVVVDGGISSAPDLAKAIAAGAESAVIGRLFYGTDEAPQRTAVKVSDPYEVRADIDAALNRGSVSHVVQHLMEGLKIAMAYAGGKDIKTFQDTATFVRLPK